MSAERLTRVDGKAMYLGRELPAGPWHDEPDHVDFRSPDGLPCILHRNGLGAWCGYVGVPPGHPWHGQPYDAVSCDVHGGLTYSGRCQGPLCHVPQPGESDDVWWLGFDCLHSGDLSLFEVAQRGRSEIPASWVPPGLGAWTASYKTVEYVRAETLSLATQAAAASA